MMEVSPVFHCKPLSCIVVTNTECRTHYHPAFALWQASKNLAYYEFLRFDFYGFNFREPLINMMRREYEEMNPHENKRISLVLKRSDACKLTRLRSFPQLG